MFRKILVANRGEIAVRIIRACRDLGVTSVAVYSEADRGALHVRLADEAWPCGPARVTESYLVAPTPLTIAERAGADALHPGYGFLSENAALAEACSAAGVAFIGPEPGVIRSMGDKLTSRQVMRDVGVPVVPGSGVIASDEDALRHAGALGMPVIVKASGGGGGRGMRIVREEKDLAAALARGRSEAASAFGNDAIYLEKHLDSPRHIEVQVLADTHGNVVHLFERECSVQRRHQKLLEEAPANIDTGTRSALGETAVRAARAVDYVGAGTVEFLMDASDSFYFLEMNTRVQVEHPVTEAVTSVDIVAEMIRVAAGEPLGMTQSDVEIRGHAIEARIYAEDPSKGFLPSPGVLEVFRLPGGPGIRVDEGVQAGDTVTPDYDALLAKVIAWGGDRAEAIRRLDRALAEFRVAGVATSIPFHRAALSSGAFRAGQYDTGFVGEHFLPERWVVARGRGSEHEPGLDPEAALRVALALLVLSEHEAGAGSSTLRVTRKGGGLGAADGPFAVCVDSRAANGATRVIVDGEPFDLDALPVGRAFSVIRDGRQVEGSVVRKPKGRFEVRVGEQAFLLQLSEEPPGSA